MLSLSKSISEALSSDTRRYEEVYLTPVQAEEILTTNYCNRTKRNRKIKAYVDAIHRGQWDFNGETVKFDKQGRLIDGQHRLEAVVMAGVATPMTFALGLDRKVQQTIDTGVSRTSGDALMMKGCKNSNSVAGAIKALISSNHVLRGGYQQVLVTNRDHADFYAANPGLDEAAMDGFKLYRESQLSSPSACIAAYYQTSQIDQKDAEIFAEGLISGIGLQAGDSRLALRRYGMTGGKSSGSLSVFLSYLVYLKAWSAFRNEESIKLLKTPKSSEFKKILVAAGAKLLNEVAD